MTSPPRGIQRLNITRLGVYWYSRSSTISLCWRIPWRWRPEWGVGDWNGSWALYWGSWCLERLRFGPGDDWGGEMAETQGAILQGLAKHLADPE